MKKVFTKRLISAILTTALIGTSAFALFGCGKASKDTSNDAKVHITNVSYDLHENFTKAIIKFLPTIGKQKQVRK